METRKTHPSQSSKWSPIPLDYAKMVNEVFTTNFDSGLSSLKKLTRAEFHFSTSGRIYADEVVLCVSLLEKGQLAATSVYASSDFDRNASTPTIQDLLSAGVDAIGTLFGQLLDPEQPERMEQIAERSLAALEKIPLVWTEIEVERHRVWVRVDKANPDIDRFTEEWLEKNDPENQERLQQEEQAIQELFITGDKAKKGHGSLH